MPIPTEQERLQTLIAGRYRLESILGRGGTGVVFEGAHTWTGRRVAVKLLKPEYARDLSLVRRFLQEARVAAGIEHPNVVEVLDMGAEPDGTVYLVLELLRGETLGDLLERRGSLPADETLRLLLPVMDALAFAHRRSIVHRDLKPDNVFIRREATGQLVPTLLDFGMARMVQEAWGHATQSGTLVGTPFYMSPEQAGGEREDVGPQSDVWSMGVILYRCLTGRLPFEASNPTALLLAIVQNDPEPVGSRAPEVPEQLAGAVDRAILRDRGERWERIDQLAAALRRAAEAAGIEVPPPIGDEAGQLEAEADEAAEAEQDPRPSEASEDGAADGPRPSRHTIAWAAAAALLLAVAALTAVGLWPSDGGRSAEPPAPSASSEQPEPPQAEPAAGAEEPPPKTGQDTQLAATASDPAASSAAPTDAPAEPEAATRPAERQRPASEPRQARPSGQGEAARTGGSTADRSPREDAREPDRDPEADEQGPSALPGIAEEW